MSTSIVGHIARAYLGGGSRGSRSRRHSHTGGAGGTAHVNAQAPARHPVLPFGAGPVLYVAGLAGNYWLLTSTLDRAIGCLVVLAAGAVLGGVTWNYAHARTTFQRWHATITPALFGTLLAFPLVAGFGKRSFLFLTVWGLTLAGSWVVWGSRSVRGDGQDTHTQAVKEPKLSELLGLGGVVVSKVELHGTPGKRPVRSTGRMTLPAPRGYKDIAGAREAIQNTAEASHVRVAPVPEHPRSADVTVVLKDMLRDPIRYVPPRGPNTSIAQPLRVGVRQDGTQEELLLLTGQGAARGLVAGCAGSGKSRLLWMILAEAAWCTDVVWWIVDVAKSGQTVGPARSMFDWVASTEEQAAGLLSAVEALITERSAMLGDDQAWHPLCGFPFLVVWIEEAAGVASDKSMAKQIKRLSERARSTGVGLWLSMQRPSQRNIDTDARAQFTSTFCFGTDDDYTGKMVLNPATIAAGANPQEYADTRPGLHWHEGPGADRLVWSEACRTYRIEPAELRQIVAASDGSRARLDSRSVAAAGEAYACRNDSTRPSSPSPAASAAPHASDFTVVSDEAADGVEDVKVTVEVIEPTSVQSATEIGDEILDELGAGVHSTGAFVERWESRTGTSRRRADDYLKSSPRVEKAGRGAWNVRPRV